MHAILDPTSSNRWLGLEPDPRDLLITYPSELMTMWPISTRVNSPANDDARCWSRSEGTLTTALSGEVPRLLNFNVENQMRGKRAGLMP